jgi:hypothetical protein
VKYHNLCDVTIAICDNLEHSSRNSRLDICGMQKWVAILNKYVQIIISEVFSMNPLCSMKDSKMLTFGIMINSDKQFYGVKNKAFSFFATHNLLLFISLLKWTDLLYEEAQRQNILCVFFCLTYQFVCWIRTWFNGLWSRRENHRVGLSNFI